MWAHYQRTFCLLTTRQIFVKGSHFLSGEFEKSAKQFDAPFFNITASEVEGSDPQHLHMLEVSYEALENAGIPIQSVAGSNTSVYVGCFTRDWEAKGGRDPYTGPFYAATGNGMSMLANRVSWFYDMRGPSMTVDTVRHSIIRDFWIRLMLIIHRLAPHHCTRYI